MNSNIGLWLDTYGGVADLLRGMRPGAVLVGEGAWRRIPEIHDVCGTDPIMVMRKIGIRLSDDPVALANKIFGASRSFPAYRLYAHGINEPTVGTKDQRQALVAWELRFINACHDLGIKTICLNLAWGNPGGESQEMLGAMEDLRPIHDASDLVGLHLYDVRTTDWVDPQYSVFRYRLWPAWFDRGRLLSTEVGIDGVADIDGRRPGWRTQKLPEALVTNRQLSSSRQWHDDGVVGGIWFAGATQNSEWSPYYPTLLMASRFGQEGLSMNEPVVRLPDPGSEVSGGKMDEATRDQLWADFEAVKIKTPMLEKVTAENPGLGDPVERDGDLNPIEHDYGNLRIIRCAKGVAWVEIGNWDHRGAAFTKQDIPLG